MSPGTISGCSCACSSGPEPRRETCCTSPQRPVSCSALTGYEQALELVKPGNRPFDAVRRSASRLFGPRTHADEPSIRRTLVQFLGDEGCMESQSLATASCGVIPSSWKPSWQVAFHFIALFLP